MSVASGRVTGAGALISRTPGAGPASRAVGGGEKSSNALTFVKQRGDRLPPPEAHPRMHFEEYHVLSRQHLGSEGPGPLRLSRRTLALGAVSLIVWRGRSWASPAAVSCAGARPP